MAARAPRFRLEPPAPAPAPSTTPAAPAAPAGRARPSHQVEIRWLRMRLSLPLDAFELRRIAELQELVGSRYQGWGREGGAAGRGAEGAWVESTWEEYFVDVLEAGVDPETLKHDGKGGGVDRFVGETLHQALGAAIRAARGDRP